MNSVKIDAHVAHDTNTGFFSYTFRISNGKLSVGSIEELSVDIQHDPANLSLDTVGLLFDTANGTYEEEYFRRNYHFLASHIDPVSFSHLPDSWESLWGTVSQASICTVSNPLKPGETIDSVMMMSKGLPSIRTFSASPEFQLELFFPSISKVQKPDSLMHVVDSIRTMVRFSGKTVGPTAPPLRFNAITWCSILSHYVSQAYALGWISDRHIEQKYHSYFKAASDSFKNSDVIGGLSTLHLALTAVDADKPARLTDEAYALIYYNTQYLMSQLLRSESSQSTVPK